MVLDVGMVITSLACSAFAVTNFNRRRGDLVVAIVSGAIVAGTVIVIASRLLLWFDVADRTQLDLLAIGALAVVATLFLIGGLLEGIDALRGRSDGKRPTDGGQ